MCRGAGQAVAAPVQCRLLHACLKQAHWVSRRNPDCRCVIFFTDLRTEGRGYEAYSRKMARDTDIEMVRARPGLVCSLPEGDGIAVKYENTLDQP